MSTTQESQDFYWSASTVEGSQTGQLTSDSSVTQEKHASKTVLTPKQHRPTAPFRLWLAPGNVFDFAARACLIKQQTSGENKKVCTFQDYIAPRLH